MQSYERREKLRFILTAGVLRRSERLSVAQSRTACPSEAAAACKQGKAAAAGKGVQKARSPQKSLEAMGFRTRRTGQARKGKQLDLNNSVLQPRGLHTTPVASKTEDAE